MTRAIIHIIAVAAALLMPTLASAGVGSLSMSTRIGSAGMTRTAPDLDKARIQSNVKVMNCHKYARGDGQGGTNWVTVCN